MAKQEHDAAIDRAPAGDDAIAGHFELVHAEIAVAVFDKHVEFLEAAMVEQQFDALAGGELAALVLRIDAGLATTEQGLGAAVIQAFENVFHGMFRF